MDEKIKNKLINYNKTLKILNDNVSNDNLSEIEKMGIVQAFELLIDQAWKILKRYLFVEGIDTKSPKSVIRECFSLQILDKPEIWIEMINRRNETSHSYDESIVDEIIRSIRNDYIHQFNLLEEVINND